MFNRGLVVAAGAQLCISVAILLYASSTPPPLPRWGGIVDVGLVITLVITWGLLARAVRGQQVAALFHHTYPIAIFLPPLLLLGMWYFRERLDFNILLPGLAWRSYLFLTLLPTALLAWNQPAPVRD